jgi:arabinan endo-1,5-alpha-L-arabinosidase
MGEMRPVPNYCNPVHDRYFADPFVLRVGDGYVAWGTGPTGDDRAFPVLTSPDLVTWTAVGGAMERLPDEFGDEYWAPEVIEQDGRWWLYYSVGHGDVGHRLRVAVAQVPTGPYVDQGIDLTPHERFAIDPHPFRDDDGTVYLYFAHDVLEGQRVGTMLAVDVLEAPTRLRGEPVAVLSPSQDWQVFLRGREMYGQVYDWHTLEGPYVRKHEGRYYCFFSGGNWQTDTYRVGFAVADHPLGPWTEPAGVPPVLETVVGHVIGPGHNSVTTTPQGLDVIVYHAWDPALTARRLCVDPLLWRDTGPVADGPSFEPRQLPG